MKSTMKGDIMKKYKLIETDCKVIFGVKLYRIQALVSFGIVMKGDKGGYIEKEDNLAQVYGDAQVSGNAWVYGNARVYGDAWVYGDAIITLLKTIQVFSYCISVTPNFVFCGCVKLKHSEIKTAKYDIAKTYMTEKQFKIIKQLVLLAIEF